MTRVRLLALLALLFVTPALAQVINVRRIPPPAAPTQVERVVLEDQGDPAKKVMTVEDAQKRISQLIKDKRQLNARLTEALATIDQMTKKGGTLVKAYCETDELSRTTAGATENCATEGYACSPVEGTCRRSCNTGSDCAGYWVCDTGRHVCVRNR